MPSSDYSLVAHFFTNAEAKEEEMRRLGIIPTLSEDGKTITYGLYPQTNVNDSTLISSLNSLTTSEANGWYLYGEDYYAKINAIPHDSNYTFNNRTTIKNGGTYWFKCEPIVWNVLSNDNGEYYIVSSVLLDAHCYYNSTLNRTIDGQTIYPNNYKYSDIRTWLNEDFYNSAFALGNEYIQTTTVEDKVFLPSYQDYTNGSYGFSTVGPSATATRYCKTTDWARARGAYYSTESEYLYNGEYWTCSPFGGDSKGAFVVGYAGSLGFYDIVNLTYHSVRPGLSIKIA